MPEAPEPGSEENAAAVAVVPGAAQVAPASREFSVRAAKAMAGIGFDQFLVAGTGLADGLDVHQAAQGERPGARVVYVASGPAAVTQGSAEAGVAAVVGDVRDPKAIFASQELRAVIDVTRPVGVLLPDVLHFVPGSQAAQAAEAFRRLVPAGSLMAISHLCRDGIPPHEIAAIEEAYSGTPVVFRTGAEIEALLGDGCWLLPPGVARVQEWRPRPGTARADGTLPVVGGVARVP
jgi:hypothetical protein